LRQTAYPGNGCSRFFSAGGRARLCIAKQKNRPSPSSASLRPLASLCRAGPVRLPPFVAMKAAMGAVDPAKESSNDD